MRGGSKIGILGDFHGLFGETTGRKIDENYENLGNTFYEWYLEYSTLIVHFFSNTS